MNSLIKNSVKKLPGAKGIIQLYKKVQRRYFKPNTKILFTEIYKGNGFRGSDSISGPGSDIEQTKVVIRELPKLLNEMNVSSFLDIPCGDFYWMRNVELGTVMYYGADIVEAMIDQNNHKYKKQNIIFQQLDIIKDPLPTVDLVFCRDCLVHLSFDNINLALGNIVKSNSKYLLTTTFTSHLDNHDIITGEWRTLNLTTHPFNLPQPVKLINEECTENNGLYSDKSLGLWRIEDIHNCQNN